jgi:uncharacterized protein
MDNQQLNARDQLLARLYKELRVEDQNNPLQAESLELYNEIQKTLIGVIRNVYQEQIEEFKRKQEEASRKTVKKDS